MEVCVEASTGPAIFIFPRLDPEWTSGFDLAAGADLLIHDAQYTDEEYQNRVGWGHSTFRHALRSGAMHASWSDCKIKADEPVLIEIAASKSR